MRVCHVTVVDRIYHFLADPKFDFLTQIGVMITLAHPTTRQSVVGTDSSRSINALPFTLCSFNGLRSTEFRHSLYGRPQAGCPAPQDKQGEGESHTLYVLMSFG